jgi:hypothetical protein
MKWINWKSCAIGLAALVSFLPAAPASAQATRTWVSGVGDDVNPCSRTAPCKTFAGAISKTAAGGEINCLDPGGFGAVTITKSMTISCPYTEGGALAGGNGVVINDGATATPGTIVVYLRGLDIFGVNPPSNGVRFVSGAALYIEDSVIRRFNAANSTGVSFAPSTNAKLYMNNVTVGDNGSGATGGGIEIRPTGTGSVKALLTNVRALNNANNGLRVDSTATTNTAGISVSIEKSYFAGNVNGISFQTGTVSTIMIEGSAIVNNSGTGVVASGGSSSVVFGNTTIMGNAIGVSTSGGSALHTYGDNRLDANPSFLVPNNGTLTLPALPKK